MQAYIQILRPVNGVMAAVAVVLGALVAGAQGTPVLMAALSAFFISGAGMVVNDYFDVNIDKINRPQRPIPSGRVSLRSAAAYSGGLFGAGIGLTFALNPLLFLLAVFNVLLEVVYALRHKATPLSGNIMVSWLVCSTYIYGGLLTGLLGGPFMLAAVAFAGNLARELYKTATDYEGDKRGGARTFAVVHGPKAAKRLGDVFVVAASLTSLLLYVQGVLGLTYLVVQTLAIVVYASAMYTKPSVAENRTKYGMLVGLIAISADLVVRRIGLTV